MATRKLIHDTGRNKCSRECNCQERKDANNEYMREYNKRKREKAQAVAENRHLSLVGQLKEVAAPEPPPLQLGKLGKLGAQVMREIAAIPGAVDNHPGLVALVLTLADQIDSGSQPQLMVSASKEIKLIMADLRPKGAAIGAAPGPSKEDAFFEKLAEAL